MSDTQIAIGNNKLHLQLISFIIIGLTATLFDFIIYEFLSTILPYTISKIISFIMGSILTYLLNKFFTFKQPVHSTAELIRFFSLYGTTLVANVFVNYLALTLLPDFVGDFLSWSYIVILAFVMATGVSTILNFTGQKLWVFKGHKNH